MFKRYRKTYVEVNLANILKNYNVIQSIDEKTINIPVVKANAYGHGAIQVVDYLQDNGVEFFAVSLLEEAIELREKFYEISIIIMGVIDETGYRISSKYNLTVTCSNFDQVNDLLRIESPIKVHLKIDTGMNRLGFKELSDINLAISKLKKNNNVLLEGVYTHVSTADSDYTYYCGQLNKFEYILSQINHKFSMIHVSNSSSIIKYDSTIDYTTHSRLGISLYGLTLDENMDFLRNTFRLITQISEIKHIKKGEKVGYGATYTATEDEIIGILPIGYADGFIRKNQGGFVEIKGNKYEIVGRVCMDQSFIRIDSSITKEDIVVLFGGIVTIDDVAKRLETINYEVVCQITSRVPRVYIK